MDSAIAIARAYNNRFRIVTLDGQVINAGGSMTGGSQDRNIGLIARRAEMDELKKQSAELSEQAKQAAEKYAAMIKAAGADEAKVVQAQSELAILGEDAARFDARLKALESQLALAEDELERLTQEKTGSADRVASLTEMRDSAERDAIRMAKELESVTARISDTACQGM